MMANQSEQPEWSSAAARAWPFTGRHDELARLTSTDPHPRVLITGPVGVGKTRLAHELLDRLDGPVLAASATGSTARIPFGAVAHLLPARLPAAGERDNVLRVLADAVLAGARGGRPVVFVDDVHLLDDDSAALLFHLAVRHDVAMVLTARTGEPVPDAVEALVRGGHAGRVALPPLGLESVGLLLERVLGGQMQQATTRQLWRCSGGNVLWLQQLVDGRAGQRSAGAGGAGLAVAGTV